MRIDFVSKNIFELSKNYPFPKFCMEFMLTNCFNIEKNNIEPYHLKLISIHGKVLYYLNKGKNEVIPGAKKVFYISCQNTFIEYFSFFVQKRCNLVHIKIKAVTDSYGHVNN